MHQIVKVTKTVYTFKRINKFVLNLNCSIVTLRHIQSRERERSYRQDEGACITKSPWKYRWRRRRRKMKRGPSLEVEQVEQQK